MRTCIDVHKYLRTLHAFSIVEASSMHAVITCKAAAARKTLVRPPSTNHFIDEVTATSLVLKALQHTLDRPLDV